MSTTLSIIIGVASSLIASILFHFAIPHLKKIREIIINLVIRSSKRADKALAKEIASYGISSNRYLLYVAGVAVGVASFSFVDRMYRDLRIRTEVVSYLEVNGIEKNAANFLQAKSARLLDFELENAKKELKRSTSTLMYLSVSVVGGLILLLNIYIGLRVSFLVVMGKYIRSFNKSIEIVRPKIGEKAYYELKREWLMMESMKDYHRIMDSVRESDRKVERD